MNKKTQKLIDALKKAFNDYDLISDNETEWSLDNLLDAIYNNPFNDDDTNDDPEKDYHAERGVVYEVDAHGYLGAAIFVRVDETYQNYLDRNANFAPPKNISFSNSITPAQAETLRKLAAEYDTANATVENGCFNCLSGSYLSGLQVVDIDDNPDHFSIEAIDFDCEHDFDLLNSLCDKAGIPESTRRADEGSGDISGYDGTKKCYQLFSFTFHVTRE